MHPRLIELGKYSAMYAVVIIGILYKNLVNFTITDYDTIISIIGFLLCTIVYVPLALDSYNRYKKAETMQ
jgi:hypothetical protein